MNVNRSFSAMRPSAAMLAVALSLRAGDAGAQRTRFQSAGGRARIDTSLAFDRRGTVTLTSGAGNIIVTGSSSDQIRIRATSDDDNIRMDAGPSRLSLELLGYRRSSD